MGSPGTPSMLEATVPQYALQVKSWKSRLYVFLSEMIEGVLCRLGSPSPWMSVLSS
jgi:hypothetical protein